MREEQVSFYSEGQRVAGLLRLPDAVEVGPYPAIVQGPGWLQLKEAKRNPPYHRAFTEAGFAVLVIDFRGFGGSEGDRRDLLPDRWLEDLVNAVTYLTTRPDVDARAIGTFGSGSTGGGNVVRLLAADPRVRCGVAQSPISDGGDWLRRMRREYEWFELLARLDDDRRTRVATGEGAMVHPRSGIMVTTPERAKRESRADVEDKHVQEVSLRSAEAIIGYRPIDVADRVSRLLVIGVEDDPVTPTDHATALYERAQAPKRLIMQGATTHYAAYDQYADITIPAMIDWYREHLRHGPVEIRETTIDGAERVEATGEMPA
jgi:dipeptidyl aminopeptidase/acylaminoacyl peptidase